MISHTRWMPFVVVAGILSLAVGAGARLKQAPNEAADQKELYSYVLTSEKVQKMVGAMKDLAALQKANPNLAKDSNDSDGSIAQTTRAMEKYPEAVAIIRKNGMTPREYVVGSMTLVQGGMAVGFKKAGTYKEYPPDMLKVVSPANLGFIEQHYDEISKVIAAFNGGDGRNQRSRCEQ